MIRFAANLCTYQRQSIIYVLPLPVTVRARPSHSQATPARSKHNYSRVGKYCEFVTVNSTKRRGMASSCSASDPVQCFSRFLIPSCHDKATTKPFDFLPGSKINKIFTFFIFLTLPPY